MKTTVFGMSCKALYTGLFLDAKPNSYLAELNDQAQNMFFRLAEELAEKVNATEWKMDFSNAKCLKLESKYAGNSST